MSSKPLDNADRMMTAATTARQGIRIVFADGCKGLFPFSLIPEIHTAADVAEIELPNPYELILRTTRGETIEIPWDFARRYCDPSYVERMDRFVEEENKTLGAGVRRLREEAGMTQEALSSASGIGRVTLARIENGNQSPRYDTLVALARALGRPLQELLVDGEEKGSS